MKQKNENHTAYLREKDAIIADLEKEFTILREKGQHRSHQLEIENQRLM